MVLYISNQKPPINFQWIPWIPMDPACVDPEVTQVSKEAELFEPQHSSGIPHPGRNPGDDGAGWWLLVFMPSWFYGNDLVPSEFTLLLHAHEKLRNNYEQVHKPHEIHLWLIL